MDEPALLVHWERTVGLVLDRTGRFPRSARHTFAARIDARALDVLEQLAVARFAKGERRLNLLQRADADLAVLRVLVRLAHTRQLLPTGALEELSVAFSEAGRMLGGWQVWARAQA